MQKASNSVINLKRTQMETNSTMNITILIIISTMERTTMVTTSKMDKTGEVRIKRRTTMKMLERASHSCTLVPTTMMKSTLINSSKRCTDQRTIATRCD